LYRLEADEDGLILGEQTVAQEACLNSFSLRRHVPAGHVSRAIDQLINFTIFREHLKPFHSELSRPSIDPELMI
jgi:hypothetical protein